MLVHTLALLAAIIVLTQGEGDVEQEDFPELSDPQECVIDIGFTLDGSGSLTLHNWMLTLRFVSEFSHYVRFGQNGTRIGVSSFGNAATLDVPLNGFDDALRFGNTVQHIRYKDENTNTASGIRLLRQQIFNVTNGDRPNVPNVGIVVTDGGSTWEKNKTILEAKLSRNAGITMFAIGIGKDVNFVELEAIANSPNDTYMLYVSDFTDLQNITEYIVGLVCDHQEPVVETTSSPMPTTSNATIDDGATTQDPRNLNTTDSSGEITGTTINSTLTSSNLHSFFVNATTITTTPNTSPASNINVSDDTSTKSSTSIITALDNVTSASQTTPSEITSTASATEANASTVSVTVSTQTGTSSDALTTKATTPSTPSVTNTWDEADESKGMNKLDLMILLDSSGSVSFEDWHKAKEFIKGFVHSMNLKSDGVRLALIEYSTKAYMKIPFGQYTNNTEVENMVDNLELLKQRTNTSGAIRMAYTALSFDENNRPDAPDVLLIVTDANSNTDNHFLIREGQIARSRGIKMFTVGIGNVTSMAQLEMITSKPYYYFMKLLDGYDSLADSLAPLTQTIMNETYPVLGLPVTFDDCPTDLVMLIDVPAIMMDQAMDISRRLSGEMPEGDRQHVVQVMTAQTGMDSSLGEDLADAFRYIRQSVFNEDNSEDNRPDAQNVVAVITTTTHPDPDILRYQIKNLKEVGIKVYTISIGQYASDDVMKDMTSDPKENTYTNVENINFLEGDLDVLTTHTKQICALASRVLWRCSFERSEPNFCNLQHASEADFQWTVTNMATPSRHTGPDEAYDGDYFAYIEASKPRRNGDKAVFFLPFTADGVFCLTFRYHMMGYHIGVLDVFVLRGGRQNLVWRMSGPQGDGWLYAQQVLILSEGDEVGIRGIRAKEFSGDIGLDSLAITRGPCPGDV